MKKLRLLYWILFWACLIFLRVRSWYAASLGKTYNIVRLELADAEEGKSLLQQWQQTEIANGTLITYAMQDTWVDFLFILGYTGVLVIVSLALRKRQQASWLKMLLGWCVALAVLAGLLDVVENIFLLLNLQGYDAGDTFYSSRYVAGPKFILLGLVLLVWIVTLLAKLFTPKQILKN